jgi:O-antigen/teichoic acid export membrane protein
MLRAYLKRLSKDVAAYGFSNAALRMLSFFLVPIYTRVFSPGEYGVLDVITTFSSLVSLGLMLGISAAIFRSYNECDKDGKDRLVSTGFWWQLTTCLGVCTAAALFSKGLSTLLFRSPKYSLFLAVALMTIPFRLLVGMPIDIMRLNFLKFRYNIFVLGDGLFQSLLAIVLVVFMKKGLMGVFVSGLASAVMFSTIGTLLISRHIKLRFSLADLRLLLSFGVPMVPASLSLWVMASSDRLFLVRMSNLHQIGLYSLGYRLASVQAILFGAFQLAWSPIAYSMYTEPGAERVFRKVFLYFQLVLGTVAMGLAMFSPELLRILAPPTYQGAYKVVGLISFATFLQGIFYIVSMGICFVKKMKYYAYANVIGALVNLSLNFLLIPPFGIIGAAVATVASFGAMAYFGNFWGSKLYPLGFKTHYVIVVAGVYAVFYSLALTFGSATSPGIFAAKLLLFLVFAGSLSVLLEQEERTLLRHVFLAARTRVLGGTRRNG